MVYLFIEERSLGKMYNDFYDTNFISSATSGFDTTWMIVSIVLAIVGGLAVYAIFVSQKNDGEYDGFLGWLHDFLNFKTFFIEAILKIMYLISAIFITLNSFSYIGVSIAEFFAVLIFGNIAARVGYELILMMITVVNNTTEINKKLSSKVTKEKETTTVAKSKKKAE